MTHLEIMEENIRMSHFAIQEIRHNLVNQLYFDKIFKNKIKINSSLEAEKNFKTLGVTEHLLPDR